jgi:hypothetical protein
MTTPPRCPTCQRPVLQGLVPLREVARYLRITPRSIFRLLPRLHIPHYRMRIGSAHHRVSVMWESDVIRLYARALRLPVKRKVTRMESGTHGE